MATIILYPITRTENPCVILVQTQINRLTSVLTSENSCFIHVQTKCTMPTILLEILGRAEKYWMAFGALYASTNLHLKYVCDFGYEKIVTCRSFGKKKVAGKRERGCLSLHSPTFFFQSH